MEKNVLRKNGIKLLREIAAQPQLKIAKEQMVYDRLFDSEFWKQAKSVGVTLSMGHELNTQPIMEQAFAENKIIAVPKTYPNREMAFLEIDKNTSFVKSSFGVDEPVDDNIYQRDLDLLVVPGVVFNPAGYRIGFGGGYYDRYLADFYGHTVSVIFKEQLSDDWRPEAFDFPVELLITDKM